MVKHRKDFQEIVRDQLSNIISHFITIPAISLILGWLGYIWSKRTEILDSFYLLVSGMNIPEFIKSAIGLLVPMLGFAVIAWAILSASVFTFKKVVSKKEEEKGEDFAIYNDLKIVKDFEQSYLDETIRHNKKYHKLWVVVQNGKTPMYDCVIELVNLEYKGRDSKNEWTDWACDKKAMKWDVGYEPREGKIDINPSAMKNLEIAVAYPQPQARMELSHLDGHSARGHLLLGEYRVTVRIDGKALVKQVKKEINPIWYEIIFKYESYNAYLELSDIKKYEPPQ